MRANVLAVVGSGAFLALAFACSSTPEAGGPTPNPATDAGTGTPTGSGTGTDTGNPSGPETPPDSGTPAPAPVQTLCKAPVFVTSDKSGGWSTNGYYVHNNMWNPAAGPETLSACAYDSWYVVSNQVDDAGAVKTYPNVHKDYADVAIGSFKTIMSTFAATSPHVGIYDVAYDIWTNGVAGPGSTEIMIWTDNYKQVPSGTKTTSVPLGGQTYDVWKTADNQYIAFVPTAVMTSGSLDLLEMFKWLMSKGWLAESSTLGQIDYGVEIVSTGGASATFQFTDFSITDN